MLCLLLHSLSFSLIAGQTQVISAALSSKNVIEAGVPLEFNCNADVVKLPDSEKNIRSVSLARKLHGSASYTTIVSYEPGFPIPGKFEYIPLGRAWTIAITEVPSASTNLDDYRKMNVKLTINDALCADGAVYQCKVRYWPGNTALAEDIVGEQNVTARAAIQNMFVTVRPSNDNFRYVENDVVTMECSVEGPPGLIVQWRYGNPNFGPLRDYTMVENILNDPDYPKSVPNTDCGAMHYRSSLNITLTEQDDGVMYACAARFEDKEHVDNITLSISAAVVSPAGDQGNTANTATGGSNDTGMIVGIIFGVLAFIIIVLLLVYFFWYRRRNGGNKDKDAENEDTKPDMHAPPPVFYSKPKKTPKDDKEDGTWDKNSDATDTWGRKPRYDTYDDDRGDDYNRRKPSSSSAGGRRGRQGSASSAVRDRDAYPSRSAYDDEDNGYGPENKDDSFGSSSKPRYEKRRPRETPTAPAPLTTTDVSGRSEDEASDAPLSGSNRQRPRPKRRTSRPSSTAEDKDDQRRTYRREDRDREYDREGERRGDPALHYAQLDLAPSSEREGGRRGGRRDDKRVDQPVEYAEIRV
ncbi:hypothetical protein EGW08_012072 [Elysia chlorotica]|uniref:Ig-like domain-containing protein n=1 Tax=Elysia chlorotica TaxID=188477 RepID=A0A433TF53_ELYCH|nr:hypothetical protein EGW08_012072 [Elysia chlorotica]